MLNNNYDIAIRTFSPNTGQQIDRVGVQTVSIITGNYGYGVEAAGGFFGVDAYGFLGNSTNTTHGVFGSAEGTSCNGGTVIGVEGEAFGASNNIGIVGGANDGSNCGGFVAAGYFYGDV